MRVMLLLADAVVVLHLAYLAYVVLGGLLGLRGLAWLWPHAATVAWGLLGTYTALPCPLTLLEKSLIRAGGGTPYDGPFIGHYLAGTVYPRAAEDLVLQLVLVVVLASYGVVLVHHRRRRPSPRRHATQVATG